MTVSVYFNIEVSQGSTYFLRKYYSRKYLKVKIPHSNLFQGEYLFPEGRNYLLVNKYWGSKYFPVNNYWGVLFFGEYLLTVTPGLIPDPGFDVSFIARNTALILRIRPYACA